jgi:hypothetical protein
LGRVFDGHGCSFRRASSAAGEHSGERGPAHERLGFMRVRHADPRIDAVALGLDPAHGLCCPDPRSVLELRLQGGGSQ